MKKAMDVVSEDMSYEETKAHLNIAVSTELLEAPKIKVSIVKMPEQWKLPEGMRTKELWAIKINVNGESFNIKVGSKDQRMVYVHSSDRNSVNICTFMNSSETVEVDIVNLPRMVPKNG